MTTTDDTDTAPGAFLCSLDNLAARQRGVIMGVTGGRGFVSRLATLGFVPGASVTMVQNYGGGPLIVSVRDTKIALGRGQAARILVHREESV